jgi:sec-independent protein translocase protein TatB
MPDILFILLLALVIFGPKKLPEIARQIAKYMAQFRQMSNDFRRQLESEMLKIELDEKQAPAKSYQLSAPSQPAQTESQPQSPPSS